MNAKTYAECLSSDLIRHADLALYEVKLQGSIIVSLIVAITEHSIEADLDLRYRMRQELMWN